METFGRSSLELVDDWRHIERRLKEAKQRAWSLAKPAEASAAHMLHMAERTVFRCVETESLFVQ